jgi:hypothetical protein
MAVHRQMVKTNTVVWKADARCSISRIKLSNRESASPSVTTSKPKAHAVSRLAKLLLQASYKQSCTYPIWHSAALISMRPTAAVDVPAYTATGRAVLWRRVCSCAREKVGCGAVWSAAIPSREQRHNS